MQHVQQLERELAETNTEKEMESSRDLQQHFGICEYWKCLCQCCFVSRFDFAIVFACWAELLPLLLLLVAVAVAVAAGACCLFITATEFGLVVSWLRFVERFSWWQVINGRRRVHVLSFNIIIYPYSFPSTKVLETIYIFPIFLHSHCVRLESITSRGDFSDLYHIFLVLRVRSFLL